MWHRPAHAKETGAVAFVSGMNMNSGVPRVQLTLLHSPSNRSLCARSDIGQGEDVAAAVQHGLRRCRR